jgi:amino acid transporter
MSALERALQHPPRSPQLGAASALSGLARREVSRLDIFAQSVAGIGPSSGALIGTVAAVQIAGTGAWLAIVLATVLTWGLAHVFGQYASRLAGSGSLYTFVARTRGPGLALAVLIALVIGYAAIAGFGVTQTAVHLAAAAVPSTSEVSTPLALAALAGVGILALVVLSLGVHISTRITLVAEVAGLALLLVLVIIALAGGFAPSSDFSLTDVSPWQILTATGLMTGAMLAFESSAALGSEAHRPFSSVPRAMTRSVLLAGLIYLCAFVAGSASSSSSGMAAADGRLWLMAALPSSFLEPIVHLVLALCFFPVALASWTALSRLLFLTGRERTTHAWLGALDARTRVPLHAILVAFLLVMAAPVVLVSLGVRTAEDSLVFAAVASPLLLSAYAVTSFTVPVFLRRINESTPGWTVAALTTGGATALLVITDLVLQNTHRQVTGIVTLLAVTLAGVIWAGVLRRRTGERAPRFGEYDQTVEADVWSATVP